LWVDFYAGFLDLFFGLVKALGSLRSPCEIQGFFASLRMTTKTNNGKGKGKSKRKSDCNCTALQLQLQLQWQKQVPFGDDKHELQ
jgi:hypothetical protein